MILMLNLSCMNLTKLLSWPICILAAGILSLPAMAAVQSDTLVIHAKGSSYAKDNRIPLYTAFNVPKGIEKIEVFQRFQTPDGKKTGIDLGLFDEKGYEFNTKGFRGWSGGSRRYIFVAQDTATPGYMPGPILPGKWHVVQMPTNKQTRTDWELEIRLIKHTSKNKTIGSSEYAGKYPAESLHPRDGKPKARYYKIDSHVHSVHSDGKWTLEQLVAMGKQNGLDGIFSTDHNTLSALKEWGKVQDTAFLVMRGMEVTYSQGHWLVLNIAKDNWVDFRIHYTDQNAFQAALDKGRKGQGMTVAAHPIAIRFMYDISRMDGVEVWNGRWNPANEKSLEIWHNLLSAGHRSVAFAATDLHGGKNLGIPCNAIWGEELSQKSLNLSMHKGNSYLVQDPGVNMDFFAYCTKDTSKIYHMGEQLIRHSSVKASFSANRDGHLILLDQNGKVREQEVKAGEKYFLEVPDNSFFIRVELRDANNNMIALSNPIYCCQLSTTFPLIQKN